ncbi:MAG: SLC13 family permease [Chloroflexi bacterium]|nr:SLC13 family permease [Chloroflexota bacterium]
MNIEQILALLIFVVMFIAIMWGKVHRFIPALVGAGLASVVILTLVHPGPQILWHVLRLYDLVHSSWWYGGQEVAAGVASGNGVEIGGVNWQTIIFIAGMMIMVEGLGAVGFFRWLCLLVAKLVHYRVVPILVTFMLLSGFLFAEILAANVGGSATMSGDPPNIIIGTALHYTFADFITNTGLIAWVGMLVVLGLFYLLFRKVLTAGAANMSAGSPNGYPEPREAITDARRFKISSGIFALVVVLLVTHAQSGLSVALIGVIAASLTLLTAGGQAHRVLKGVDWRTLVFFLGLFVTVGGLEATGVLRDLADLIGRASGGNAVMVMSIILWVSALASSVVDNIPFAATMVPVIKNLAAANGLNMHPLAWALALGTDIGGNGTPIGASANVVGTAIAEKEGYHISWGRFCKYAFPAMLLVVGLCNVYLVLRYG